MNNTKAVNTKYRGVVKKIIVFIIIVVPFDIWSIPTPGGRAIKPVWIVGTCLVLYFIYSSIDAKRGIYISNPFKAIIGFNIIALLSVINLINSTWVRLIDYGTLWAQLIVYSLIFLCITSSVFEKKQLTDIVKAWMWVALIMSIYAIYQVFAQKFGLPLGRLPITNPTKAAVEGYTRLASIGPLPRAHASFSEPSFLGTFLIPPLFIAGFLFIYRKRVLPGMFSRRFFHSIVFFIIVSAFVLTFSLSAYVSVATGVAIALFNRKTFVKRLRFITFLVFVFLIISSVVMLSLNINFYGAVYTRTITTITDIFGFSTEVGGVYAVSSAETRLEDIKKALEVAMQNPLLGYGLNSKSYYNLDGVPSGFIHAFTQMGVLGPSALFGVFYATISHLSNTIRKIDSNTFIWTINMSLYYAVLSVGVNVLVARDWQVASIWMTLALAVLTSKVSRL